MEKNWYDKNYKFLLLLPAVFLLFSIIYLYNFQSKNGDLILKDVTLTGGTTVTVFDSKVDIDSFVQLISVNFPDAKVRKISDFRTGGQTGFIIETQKSFEEIRPSLEENLGYSLNQDNSSVEFSSSSLSQGFYYQLRNSIIVAFLLMGWVIFMIFGESRKIKSLSLILTAVGVSVALSVNFIKYLAILGVVVGFGFSFRDSKNNKDYAMSLGATLFAIIVLFFYSSQIILVPVSLVLLLLYGFYSVPSLAVILSAFADIVMTIVVVDLSGIVLSTAGIISFLMLIGYSVDTDILLTKRVIRGDSVSVNQRLYSSFRTGLMMTLTSIAAVGVAFIIVRNSSEVLRQIFTILLIGLGFDMFNTWITNTAILKWYVEKKEEKR
ncbi:hypothetical protein HY450_02375 [Candidatus Pacearchaeota archaeon]|nr:hypothetical protein [Candidatus Pacearchaeota archaeon]